MVIAPIKHMKNLSESKTKRIKTLLLAGVVCGSFFIRMPIAVADGPLNFEPTTLDELEDVQNYMDIGENFYIAITNPLRISLLKQAGLPADNIPHPGEAELLKKFYPQTYAAAEKAVHALLGPIPFPMADDNNDDEKSCWEKDKALEVEGVVKAVLAPVALGDSTARKIRSAECQALRDKDGIQIYTQTQCEEWVDGLMRSNLDLMANMQLPPFYIDVPLPT